MWYRHDVYPAGGVMATLGEVVPSMFFLVTGTVVGTTADVRVG